MVELVVQEVQVARVVPEVEKMELAVQVPVVVLLALCMQVVLLVTTHWSQYSSIQCIQQTMLR
jgi:hypothetical protein